MAFSPVTGSSSGEGQERAQSDAVPDHLNVPRQEFQPDPLPVLSSLHEAVKAGEHTVDAILEAVAEAAQVLTRANSSAIALHYDGEVVCRARSGEPAPAIGSRLSVDS